MIQQDVIYNKIKELFPSQKIVSERNTWGSWAFSVDDKIVRVAKMRFDKYRKEAAILNFLRYKTSYQIPKTHLIETDNISYSIHDKIIGKKWDMDTFKTLGKKQRELFCQDIAQFFFELHSISKFDIKIELPMLYNRLEKYSIQNIKIYLKDILSSKEIEQIGYIIEKDNDSECVTGLLHKDFHPGNSLVDDNYRLLGIYDFINSRIGDVSYEFLPLYYKGYNEILNCVIKHYTEMTSFVISKEKLKNLMLLDNLKCLVYLQKNPEVKSERKDSFYAKLKNVHTALV